MHNETVYCKDCRKKLAWWDMFTNIQYDEEWECPADFRQKVTHVWWNRRKGRKIQILHAREPDKERPYPLKTQVKPCALIYRTKYCRKCAEKRHFKCGRPKCKGHLVNLLLNLRCIVVTGVGRWVGRWYNPHKQVGRLLCHYTSSLGYQYWQLLVWGYSPCRVLAGGRPLKFQIGHWLTSPFLLDSLYCSSRSQNTITAWCIYCQRLMEGKSSMVPQLAHKLLVRGGG